MHPTRRSVVRGGAGLLAAGGLGGCLDDGVPGGSGGSDGGYAAFFTLADLASNVGGDTFEVTNPVPAGDMGHQWAPEQGLRESVLLSGAFVYLGVEGFQRWAMNTVRTVEEEGSETVTIDVTEGIDLHSADHDHGNGTGDHDGSDRGGVDPHYWLDPVLAAESVETIADGFAEADPDDADVYEENAETYRDRLDDLHEEFETTLADRDHDVAVVAGHNSYQYLAERYGFDVHSPEGVQPDARPSTDDVADTVELIDETGVDAICYDHFESIDGNPPPLAETILAESSATEAVAVTSAEGTTDEWNEAGYGYVEQMREITLPAFRRALGAN